MNGRDCLKPFAKFPAQVARRIRYVLTDVDDTLTDGPRVLAATYGAMERLRDSGRAVIPVTAASAGWCDLMCRMWPVAAVIGENGGLCFRHNPVSGATERCYWVEEPTRRAQLEQLIAIGREICATDRGCEIAHDQRYRETTLALRNSDPEISDAILSRLRTLGAQTTVNSLWVLAWLSGFDKLAMTRRVMRELFAIDLDCDAERCLYVGDSLNDEPMFGFFANSVGVANIRSYLDRLGTPPKWITSGASGAGFVEIAERLLARALPASQYRSSTRTEGA